MAEEKQRIKSKFVCLLIYVLCVVLEVVFFIAGIQCILTDSYVFCIACLVVGLVLLVLALRFGRRAAERHGFFRKLFVIIALLAAACAITLSIIAVVRMGGNSTLVDMTQVAQGDTRTSLDQKIDDAGLIDKAFSWIKGIGAN